MCRLCAVFSLLLAAATYAAPQSPKAKPEPATKSDQATEQSKEGFIVESFLHKETFEDDGTSVKQDTARVRIQSEAGVQHYSLLAFSYASGTGNFTIDYLRVRKPDGSTVETPPEDAQDMAAEITRQAPFYSDLHEKHIAVKGLSPGDILEYQVQDRTTRPLAPGQFWTSYRFTDTEIVLNEQFEISVPAGRKVKVKSKTVQPSIEESNGRRIYMWQHSNLHRRDEKDSKREATELAWQQARGRLPQFDVLMSSFGSWEEVGRWYGGLQDERVKPTAEVAAKANELTKNATTPEAKISVLYDYVGTQFHYIGVAFGIGRYQPHSAEAVLENQYGDCKDKHTLLASLLTAVGIPAYPALISTSFELDEDVPSPGQFDHVITYVPRDKDPIWLDTTAEVAPFSYLTSPLRAKHALVVWKDKPPALTETPVDPPFESSQIFHMKGRLSEAGTIEGDIDFLVRGDLEYLLRVWFRAVPVARWKELGQRVSYGSGFGGDVNEVTASSPEKTSEPFHFSYKYTRKDFGDWPNRRILSPEPLISLLAPSDEELMPEGPLWLGPLLDFRFESEVEIPAEYHPQLPPDIHLKEDFAEFDSKVQFKDGKMISERHLRTLLHEVPAKEHSQYAQFMKTVLDAYGTFIPLLSSSPPLSATTVSPRQPSLNALQNLPPSLNEEAARLETSARESFANHDLQGAVSSLYRAVSADPKFARAWVMLGAMLFTQKETEAAMDAFNKAMAAAPTEAAIPKALGYALMADSKFEEAVQVWQGFIKSHPDDPDGFSNLGLCLVNLKRYAEAAAAYESSRKPDSDTAATQEMLGSIYLRSGDREKATAAFKRVGELDEKGDYFNDSAYLMANADLELPMALDYAEKAVAKVETESQSTTLDGLSNKELKDVTKLAAYWDTLGWVNERMSNFWNAEKYLEAAWKVAQDGVVASHLCRLYSQMKKNAKALEMCQTAVYRMPLSQMPLDQYQAELDSAKANLEKLTHTLPANSTDVKRDVTDVANRERTFKLPRFLAGTESADVFVLLASDGTGHDFKAADVKFISGSEKMKHEVKQLQNFDFKLAAPDNVPTRFVRKGILGCYQYTGCSLVLLDPGSVQLPK